MLTRVTSKIKTTFDETTRRYIAAICDTKRIDSNADKMILLLNLLYTNKVKFEILGGATNRIALQIEGYAFKFAVDEQGYKDNLMEYSLSPELQPYVTKAFETNGYVLIAECVEVMNQTTFERYRYEIQKVLDMLAQDYLLGDVGYLKKNMANWGIRNNKPVILDYAYCHRATENLFTCSSCGSILTYDSVYDKLMCTDRSGCKAVYTYNQRKRIQGNQVDIDMIDEIKAESIILTDNNDYVEVNTFEDRLVSDKYFIINDLDDLRRYNKIKEEKFMAALSVNGVEGFEDRLDALIELAMNPNNKQMQEIVFTPIASDVPEAIYTDEFNETYLADDYREEPVEEDDVSIDAVSERDSMIDTMLAQRQEEIKAQEEIDRERDNFIKDHLDKKYGGKNKNKAKNHVQQQKFEEDKSEEGQDVIDERTESLVDTIVNSIIPSSNDETSEEESVEPEEVEFASSNELAENIDVDALKNSMSGGGFTESSRITVNGQPLNVGEEVDIDE